LFNLSRFISHWNFFSRYPSGLLFNIFKELFLPSRSAPADSLIPSLCFPPITWGQSGCKCKTFFYFFTIFSNLFYLSVFNSLFPCLLSFNLFFSTSYFSQRRGANVSIFIIFKIFTFKFYR
jgi:hypothetical protein